MQRDSQRPEADLVIPIRTGLSGRLPPHPGLPQRVGRGLRLPVVNRDYGRDRMWSPVTAPAPFPTTPSSRPPRSLSPRARRPLGRCAAFHRRWGTLGLLLLLCAQTLRSRRAALSTARLTQCAGG